MPQISGLQKSLRSLLSGRAALGPWKELMDPALDCHHTINTARVWPNGPKSVVAPHEALAQTCV